MRGPVAPAPAKAEVHPGHCHSSVLVDGLSRRVIASAVTQSSYCRCGIADGFAAIVTPHGGKVAIVVGRVGGARAIALGAKAGPIVDMPDPRRQFRSVQSFLDND